jgi:branched-chain amino acid transport system ATP-binding protein
MKPLLVVDQLSKGFGAVKAVASLTFDVKGGEIVGLIGPNGAGKTTAISLISGGLQPDSGSVRFDGERVTGMAAHRLVQRGLVRTFQSTTVYADRDVWTNVLRGAFRTVYGGFWPAMLGTPAHRRRRDAARENVRALLQELGLSDVQDVLARNLPYGRQKTLGLAIALAAQPRLILLDEPAAGLSSAEADRVADVIAGLTRRGVSVVVVDHNMRFIARLCDRVVVMHHGAELCIGTPAEVTRDAKVIEAYLGAEHEPA